MNEDSNLLIASEITNMLRHEVANTYGLLPPLILQLQEILAEKKISSDEIDNILKILIDTARQGSSFLSDQLKSIQVFNQADELSRISVNSIIQESLKDFVTIRKSFGENLFELNLTPDLPDVRANKEVLNLGIKNLIQNAVDAVASNTDKSSSIKIKSHIIPGFIAIDIIDNGSGIRKEISKHLFKSHFTTKRSGHGLGLFLTKNSINRIGGDVILVSSDEGETVFRILLREWTSSISLSGKNRVLIVDDNLAFQNAFSLLLSNRGFDVNVAGTVSEARKAIKNTAFDIAILDMRLEDNEFPQMTGLDIAKMIREYNLDALILVLSAYADSAFMKNAFEIGVDAWLDKGRDSVEEIISFVEKTLPEKLSKVSQQREIRRESLRLEQIDGFINETLSIFSHELRSPLLTAKRNAELLMSGTLGKIPKNQSRAIETIYTALNREFALLDILLNLNRTERGLENFNYETCDLVQIMKQEIIAHQNAAKEKNIGIKYTLPKKTTLVSIDVNRFKAALNPLMDNAIKFSDDGGNIVVSMKLYDRYVEVHISDQGPGINPNELDYLLGRDISPNIKMNQRIRASGLGLHLAKRIIEDYHDGKLWFIEKPEGEKGTTVAFRLTVQE